MRDTSGNRLTDPHHLHAIDDSGVTSVATCACGDTFLGVGSDHVGEAVDEWRTHWRKSAEAAFTAAVAARVTGGPRHPDDRVAPDAPIAHLTRPDRIVLHVLNTLALQGESSAPTVTRGAGVNEGTMRSILMALQEEGVVTSRPNPRYATGVLWSLAADRTNAGAA